MDSYLELVEKVLGEGTLKENRTGEDTISYFGGDIRHNSEYGFPLLTTKKMFFKGVLAELIWFLRGTAELPEDLRPYLKFWEPWVRNGRIPSAYGYYWRNYPVESTEYDFVKFNGQWMKVPENVAPFIHFSEGHSAFDQIGFAIRELRYNPNSRRLVVLAWEPLNAALSYLPPCHYTFVLNVLDGRLNLHWTQRSADVGLGVPFNIASYTLLMHLIAKATGLQPGEVKGDFVDTHIYKNHVDQLKEQLSRIPKPLGVLKIDHDFEKDPYLRNLTMDSVKLIGYESYGKLQMEAAV